MTSPLVVALAIVAAGQGGDPSPDRAAYEAARKEAGSDAVAQVRLALWCEQHGMTAERLKHLAAAVLHDPSNALARGLLGLVAFDGKWERPDDAGREIKADEALSAKLAEYNGRRDRMAHTAEANWKLALWCEQVGLKAEAKAHLSVVTQLDPARDAAWKHLGFKKVGNRWVTESQLAAERAEARAQKQADAHWRPLLTRWRGWLIGKDRARRQDAEEALAGVTDPRAVPAVWSLLAAGDATLQAKAVQVLGQIDASGATRAVAMLTINGRSAEVRQAAVEVLRRRDPRDFLGLLVAMVRDPLKYEIRPGPQPNSPGELFVEGRRYNVDRQYYIDPFTFQTMTQFAPRFFDSSVPFDPFGPQNMWLATFGALATWGNISIAGAPTAHPQGAPASPAGRMVTAASNRGLKQTAINSAIFENQVMAAQRDILIGQQMLAAQQVINLSRQQLRDDVNAIEAYNAEALRVNDLAVPVLVSLTGQNLGTSHEPWEAWWTDQRGYAYKSPESDTKPTYTEFVENPVRVNPWHSCFGAGTTVQTLVGPRPIELIRVGDRVLSQETRTGRLAFTPVVAVFHNKPAPTLRVELGDQAIVATGIHRFWKAGSGWTMARDLKAGDILRVLGGTARVVAVGADSVQPVFNLEVTDGHSFFVGSLGALVHDNSAVQPVKDPFDAIEPPAQAASSTRAPHKSMLGR